MGGNDLDKDRNTIPGKAANKQNWEYVNEFSSTYQLLIRVRNRLRQPPYPCLKRLEIIAHGSPTTCDGIRPMTFRIFARQYKQILHTDYAGLCDETHIILSGCNTGLSDHFGNGPVAEQLVNEIPFNNNSFPIHVSVWGTRGYMAQGTSSMQQNASVIEGPESGYTAYPNAAKATGRSAWIRFNNW